MRHWRVMSGCLAWTALTCACGSDTKGELVQVSWQLDQNSPDNADFSTATGYDVHLDQAVVALGAAYAYAPAAQSPSAVAHRFSFTSVAYAHGGLDAESGRRVLAELPAGSAPIAIDALSSQAIALPTTSAEAGNVDALKLELAAAGAISAEPLRGAVVQVRGQATRDGQTLRFSATLDDVTPNTIDLTDLTAELSAGSVLHIQVHPRTWLDRCEFAELAPSTTGGSTATEAEIVAPADSQLIRALQIGVRNPEAWGLQIQTGE